jgi:hypothetical protein
MRSRLVMVLTGGRRPFRTRRHKQLRLGSVKGLNLASRALYQMKECDATPTHSSNRSRRRNANPEFLPKSAERQAPGHGTWFEGFEPLTPRFVVCYKLGRKVATQIATQLFGIGWQNE